MHICADGIAIKVIIPFIEISFYQVKLCSFSFNKTFIKPKPSTTVYIRTQTLKPHFKKDRMKKIIAFTMILAVAGFSATAQERRTMKGKKHGMHQQHGQKKEMIKDLNLTDAQKAQLKTDREAYKVKMDALKKDENITVKEMKAREKAIHEEQKTKMQALLTPDQKAKIAANKTGMETNRKNMDAMGGNDMKEKLGLSNDQAAKLKAHNQETHSKIKAIQDNQSLSMEQKKEQIKAVKEASKTQRKNILTAEQLKRMQEMQKDNKTMKADKRMKGNKSVK